MSQIIDITNKIKNEEKFIKLRDKTYKVNDSKNAVLEVMDLMNKESGARMMQKALEIMLGKPASKDIEAMNLNMEDYRIPFIAVMACISGDTYDKAEARFRQSEESVEEPAE